MRVTIVMTTAALLVACFAALDDITTGNEPGLVLEWVAVAITASWCAGLLAVRVRRPGRRSTDG